jgi:RimJ/RimL family protein N-acetyltransferase
VGFLTAPHARGRGYMSAALARVARYGIEELGIKRVEWKAHVGNDASRRVAEKAGFRYEGILRSGVAAHGERFDTWISSFLPEDMTPGRPEDPIPGKQA